MKLCPARTKTDPRVNVQDTEKSHICYAEQKRADTGDYVLYDSTYMNFRSRQNQRMPAEVGIVVISEGPLPGRGMRTSRILETSHVLIGWGAHV